MVHGMEEKGESCMEWRYIGKMVGESTYHWWWVRTEHSEFRLLAGECDEIFSGYSGKSWRAVEKQALSLFAVLGKSAVATHQRRLEWQCNPPQRFPPSSIYRYNARIHANVQLYGGDCGLRWRQRMPGWRGDCAEGSMAIICVKGVRERLKRNCRVQGTSAVYKCLR